MIIYHLNYHKSTIINYSEIFLQTLNMIDNEEEPGFAKL